MVLGNVLYVIGTQPFSWYSSSLNHAWHMRHAFMGKDSIQGDGIVLDNGPMGPIFLVWIGQTLWVLECTVRDWEAAIFLVQ